MPIQNETKILKRIKIQKGLYYMFRPETFLSIYESLIKCL